MKRSREYRFEQKERVIKNRKKLMKVTGLEHSKNDDNRYSKAHPYDCGISNCQRCRTHKKEWDKVKKMKLPLEDNEDG
jgi:hypothetical protein